MGWVLEHYAVLAAGREPVVLAAKLERGVQVRQS